MERGRGKRYSADLKRRIVLWAAKRHAGGASWATISGELGLGLETIRRWVLAAAPTKPAPSRALVPVQIAQPSTPTATDTVSVVGWRIDGLTVSEAAAIVRALS